jgi:hypothetical protein
MAFSDEGWLDTLELELLRDMSPEQRQLFTMEMAKFRKDPTFTFILNLFGLHRIYLDEIGFAILQWFSCLFFGFGFPWMFTDLFRFRTLTRNYRHAKARQIATAVRDLYPATELASKSVGLEFTSQPASTI